MSKSENDEILKHAVILKKATNDAIDYIITCCENRIAKNPTLDLSSAVREFLEHPEVADTNAEALRMGIASDIDAATVHGEFLPWAFKRNKKSFNIFLDELNRKIQICITPDHEKALGVIKELYNKQLVEFLSEHHLEGEVNSANNEFFQIRERLNAYDKLTSKDMLCPSCFHHGQMGVFSSKGFVFKKREFQCLRCGDCFDDNGVVTSHYTPLWDE